MKNNPILLQDGRDEARGQRHPAGGDNHGSQILMRQTSFAAILALAYNKPPILGQNRSMLQDMEEVKAHVMISAFAVFQIRQDAAGAKQCGFRWRVPTPHLYSLRK